MSKTIRIGTRASELALWQANTVKDKLEALGYQTTLIPVKSSGDLNLDEPLYEMGITGIFTKALDVAMVKGEIDIAVHSMKDVPTALPKGIVQTAVLPRANVFDILIHKGLDFLDDAQGTIATGSLRRKAQWLNRYPHHQVVNLRGNVNTRLRKLDESDWNGAIFAAAGLERINLKPDNFLTLDWMIPAPAQGTMLVVAKADDDFSRTATQQLNHRQTEICVTLERSFLRVLEGGCTAPIGALAQFDKGNINFKGALFSLDGTHEIIENITFTEREWKGKGVEASKAVLRRGGAELMADIKQKLG